MKCRIAGCFVALSSVVLGLLLFLGANQTPRIRVDGKSVLDLLRDLGEAPEAAESSASNAIRSLGAQAIPDLLVELTNECPKWVQHLERAGGRLKWLQIGALSRKCSSRRFRAVLAFHAIGEKGAPAIPILEHLLTNSSECSFDAGMALGGLGPSALPALSNALGSVHAAVRANALIGIELIAEPAASMTDTVCELAKHDGNRWVRIHAASALGTIGQADYVVPLLADLARDRDSSVRERAVAGLSRFFPLSQEANAVIERARTDEDSSVRAAAARSLRGGPL
jgi:hypothetical protein